MFMVVTIIDILYKIADVVFLFTNSMYQLCFSTLGQVFRPDLYGSIAIDIVAPFSGLSWDFKVNDDTNVLGFLVSKLLEHLNIPFSMTIIEGVFWIFIALFGFLLLARLVTLFIPIID